MKILIKTLQGLEEVLMKEVELLGGQNIKKTEKKIAKITLFTQSWQNLADEINYKNLTIYENVMKML